MNHISMEPLAILMQFTRVMAFLMAVLAFRSAVRYKRTWRMYIFAGILCCYVYLVFSPLGGPGGNPNANPPNVINVVLNTFFALLFWQNSGKAKDRN